MQNQVWPLQLLSTGAVSFSQLAATVVRLGRADKSSTPIRKHWMSGFHMAPRDVFDKRPARSALPDSRFCVLLQRQMPQLQTCTPLCRDTNLLSSRTVLQVIVSSCFVMYRPCLKSSTIKQSSNGGELRFPDEQAQAAADTSLSKHRVAPDQDQRLGARLKGSSAHPMTCGAAVAGLYPLRRG